jgi:IS5 family transposase
MTRRTHGQLLLGEIVLFGLAMPNPGELMDPELQRIDKLLDDETLVDAVLEKLRQRYAHSRTKGRPGTPADVALRMLVLKHLRHWSYPRLQWEVTGNIAYRQFCRIGAEKVPDEKTLLRLSHLLGESVLQSLCDRLVQIAVERKVTRGRTMRVDTTVVEAPIAYPTDSDLCEDGIRVLQRHLQRLLAAGVKLPFVLEDKSRSVARRMREIAQALRRRAEAAKQAMHTPYRKLLRITARLRRQSEQAIAAASEQLESLPQQAQRKAQRALRALETFAPRVEQVVKQTRARVLRGITDSKGKLISIFEPTARILRRGKLHKPTEFGQLVVVQEAEGGIVTDASVTDAGHDSELLVGTVERHIELFGKAPTTAATDRGFYSKAGEQRIKELGVRHAAIPKPGDKSKARTNYERQRWFKRARAWRAGGEARISRLKHTFGMDRSRYRGPDGITRTVKWAAIANNLVAIARA